MTFWNCKNVLSIPAKKLTIKVHHKLQPDKTHQGKKEKGWLWRPAPWFSSHLCYLLHLFNLCRRKLMRSLEIEEKIEGKSQIYWYWIIQIFNSRDIQATLVSSPMVVWALFHQIGSNHMKPSLPGSHFAVPVFLLLFCHPNSDSKTCELWLAIIVFCHIKCGFSGSNFVLPSVFFL